MFCVVKVLVIVFNGVIVIQNGWQVEVKGSKGILFFILYVLVEFKQEDGILVIVLKVELKDVWM